MQGYGISDQEIELSFDEFSQQYADSTSLVTDRSKLNFAAERLGEEHLIKENRDRIYIFYSRDKSVGIKVMREFVVKSQLHAHTAASSAFWMGIASARAS